MGEIIEITNMTTTATYGEFKQTLDQELQKTAEGFVRIGYLLKVARDTEVLKESGYSSVAEFAQAEYGLTKDVVSRYININDKYSEEGYSDKLQERYRGFGYTKLAEMLNMPESVIEELTPEVSKSKIQEIKKEIREEEQITDVEVMLEGEKGTEDLDSMAGKAIFQYYHENREEYLEVCNVLEKDWPINSEYIEAMLNAIAPSGYKTESVRVQGIGRIMFSVKGKDFPITFLNVRNNEKEEITFSRFGELIDNMYPVFFSKEHGPTTAKEAWEKIYGEPFTIEKKEEVAPVQQINKPEEKKEEKPVETAGTEDEKEKNDSNAVIAEDNKEEVVEKEQGSVINLPESDTKAGENVTKKLENVTEHAEIVEKTESKPNFEAEMEAVIEEDKIEMDLREKALELSDIMIAGCLQDWEGANMPIEDIRKCIENTEELLSVLKELEAAVVRRGENK